MFVVNSFSKGIRGLALTGWQRYDHFAVLCELLPVGIPSLITSLSTVSKGYFVINPKENDILRVLECAFHPDSRWVELKYPLVIFVLLFNEIYF